MTSTKELPLREGKTEPLLFSASGSGDGIVFNERDIVCSELSPSSENPELIYVVPSSDEGKLPSTQVLRISRVDREDHSSLLESVRLNPYGRTLRHGSAAQDGLKVITIISTGSGSQQARDVYDRLIRPMLPPSEIAKSEDSIYTTTSRSSISDLVRDVIVPNAKAGQRQLIILLSGDGGIADIVDNIHGASRAETHVSPTVALIPCGTGNALAHSSGIMRDGTWGLSSLMRGNARPIPTFFLQLPQGSFALDEMGRPERRGAPAMEHGSSQFARGAVVFSWALHATLVADSDTPEFRKHGSQRFGKAAKDLMFPELGEMHQWKGAVEYLRPGEKNWVTVGREEHHYVLLTLVSNLEEKFCVSPKSKPLDGKMRLVHFGPREEDTRPAGELVMELMMAGYAGGKHVEDERVGYEEVDRLRLTIYEEDEKWRRVCVDGTIWVLPRGSTVEVVRDKVELIKLLVLG